jgi:hypothetical protein
MLRYFSTIFYKNVVNEDHLYPDYKYILYNALRKITLDRFTNIIFLSIHKEITNIINETILNTCRHFIYQLIR